MTAIELMLVFGAAPIHRSLLRPLPSLQSGKVHMSKSSALQKRPERVRTALVVEDSPSQQLALSAMLERRGYATACACNFSSALDLFHSVAPDFVIADAGLPDRSGIELGAVLRETASHPFYLIVVSAQLGQSRILSTIETSADAFIAKPITEAELVARMQAGERVLALQNALTEKNRVLEQANERLKRAHDSMERDLMAAAELQLAAMPPDFAHCAGFDIVTVFRPCARLSGDLVGYFTHGEDKVVAYSIDVAGHGVSAALLTTALAQVLNRSELSVSFKTVAGGKRILREPSETLEVLNDLFQDWGGAHHYFTIAYAILDTRTGAARLSLAGHPQPVILATDGSVRLLGGGSMPAGLLPDASYQTFTDELGPGDQLLFYSDAFLESLDDRGQRIGSARFIDYLRRLTHLDAREVGERLLTGMHRHFGCQSFQDDASALIMARAMQAPDAVAASGA